MPKRNVRKHNKPQRGAGAGRPPEVTVADVPRLLERYEPSNALSADVVGTRSARVCHWRCPAGTDHVYQAKAEAAFKSSYSGCPFCTGRQLSVTNRLDILFPQIADDWADDLNGVPPVVVSTSSKTVWWRCAACKHQWTSRIGRRTREGSGCPRCTSLTNASRLPGTSWGREPQTTVAAIPHMAVRYDPDNDLPAEEVAARSTKVRRWRCPDGPDHVYETRPATVLKSAHGGCPFCGGRELSVTNNLGSLHPEIAAEWDVELNGCSPAVVATSAQRAWWRCATCDHFWETTVNRRTVSGTGCPQCDRRARVAASSRPRPGRSLSEVAPAVVATWHPTRNAPVGPEDVPAMSNTPRWWLCEDGHEWETAPSHRAGKRSSGCPFCNGQLVTAETSLAARYPDIAAEWHPTLNGELTPETLLPSASKKIWWRCPAGHDYDSLPGNRTRNGNGCPYCAGFRIGYGNDLATLAPAVASEWDHEKNHPLKPTDVTTGGAGKYWWLCEQGHSWETTVPSRVNLGTGCPRCWAGWRRSLPEIVLQYELAYVLQAPVTGDTEVRTPTGAWHVDVLCTPLRIIVEYDGSFWHRGCLERDARKTQDLISDGWIVVRVRQAPLPMVGPWDVPGHEKDPDTFIMTLQVLDRILAAAAAAPVNHAAREQTAVLHERFLAYQAGGVAQASDEAKFALTAGRINRPRLTSSGLPRPLKPGQSLAEKSPETAAEWHPKLNNGLTALDVANGRNTKAWWRCSLCGKDWEANINGRTRVHSVGCPDCARTRGLLPKPGQSLADLHPDISAEWHPTKNHPLLPVEVNPGSRRRVWWRCSLCGNDWETVIHNRMKHKNVGCPSCGRTRRGAEQALPKPGQSLADLFPHVAAQWHPDRNGVLCPEGVRPHSNQSVWWRCEDGHEWQTGIYCRTGSNPTGCPGCWKMQSSSSRMTTAMTSAKPRIKTGMSIAADQPALW